MPRSSRWVAAAGWALIAVTTLPPAPPNGGETSPYCLLCGEYGAADALQNLILFLPLGLGLGLARWRPSRALAAVLLTTLLVESLQLALIPGRDASLGDLVTNSLGGALGFLLAAHSRAWLLPGRSAARRLARLGIAAWLLVMALCTWALSVDPLEPPYTPLWWPRVDDAFRGEPLSVHFAGVDTRDREPLPTPPVAAAIDRRQLPVRIVLRPGPPTPAEDAILEVVDPASRQLHSLAVDGRDLVLDFYTRATALGLRYPRLRLRDAIPNTLPDTLLVTGGLDGERMWLRVTAPGWDARRTLVLGPAVGWLALFPFGYDGAARVALVTLGWLATLLLPVGYWAGRADGGGTTLALLAGAAGIAFWILPLLLHLAPLPLPFLPAPLAGVAAGWLMGRRTRTCWIEDTPLTLRAAEKSRKIANPRLLDGPRKKVGFLHQRGSRTPG